ncbi:asparaginase [Hahella sp. SMD15-11]|uniref:asparaginase n=1 Tax=Thermohahella caldifontis TaxID=3142973 RepID=A0AB39UUD5_9GAMM
MNRRKRIYIAYTGGTIGMQRTPSGYAPVPGFSDLVNEKIPPRLAISLPELVMHEYPRLIDSSDIRPAHWFAIARDIADRYDDFDGFVILHGTDTMAYTASALSFLLRDLTKPVIVTGSQIPLVELRNDAQNNLVTAIELAADYPIPEVALYFNGRLLRGNRASKYKATGFDAFDSPNYPWLADVGIFIDLNTDALLPCPAETAFELPAYTHNDVRVAHLYPGLTGEQLLALGQGARALILRTYGVGNGPASDTHFMDALRSLHAAGTVLVNVTQCVQGSVTGSYATGTALARTGLLPAGDMTLEAAYTKLYHLCATGLSGQALADAFLTPRCGEVSA